MIGAVEAAMIAQTVAYNEGAPNALGYTLRKIDTYGGDFADGLERIVKDFPAVLFVFNGFERITEAQMVVKIKAKWCVICCANSLRNEASARAGSVSGVGSYQLAEDMIQVICGENFGLNITRFMPTGLRPLVNDKAGKQLASIYGLDVETTWTINLAKPTDAPGGDRVGLFETFHNNWDIPPIGNVSTTLPADDTADATDNVELST